MAQQRRQYRIEAIPETTSSQPIGVDNTNTKLDRHIALSPVCP
jgi:hypothetical protein